MLLFTVVIGMAVITAIAANSRGRNSGLWFIFGLCLPLFSFIAVLVMPDLRRSANEPTPETHVKCPDCAELIKIDAKICRYCGCRVVPQNIADLT